MAKMPKQVMDLINDPEAVKFLATIDAEGKPNCALIASLSAASEDTLIFAELMMNKTKKNLISTRKVAAPRQYIRVTRRGCSDAGCPGHLYVRGRT